MSDLRPGERIDDLQRNGYRIIQNPDTFCFGIDAVLLSDFARVKETETCLDLGCGNGILPLLLAAKTPGKSFTGLEILPYSADLARRSVSLNHLEDRIRIVQGDIKDASNLFGASSFDVIVTNPPYLADGKGPAGDNDEKAAARHETRCDLADVLRAGEELLPRGGHFFMVHRSWRLSEIIARMSEYGIEPKRIRLVYPFADREANLVLIEGVRGGKPGLTVEKPLIVYEKPGKYTEEIDRIYGD